MLMDLCGPLNPGEGLTVRIVLSLDEAKGMTAGDLRTALDACLSRPTTIVPTLRAGAEATAEVARLREALLRYGRHDDGEGGATPCRSLDDGSDTCTCGLDDARRK